jgi:hypothetical protein
MAAPSSAVCDPGNDPVVVSVEVTVVVRVLGVATGGKTYSAKPMPSTRPIPAAASNLMNDLLLILFGDLLALNSDHVSVDEGNAVINIYFGPSGVPK